MATFAIYKCVISAIVDDVFVKNPTEHLTQGQHILESVLQNLPTATKITKSGEEKPCTTTILCNDQNIHVWHISDPKDVTLTNEQQAPYDADHFPPCYAIFDNREDIGLLAIEKRSDAFSCNPDKLRDILEKLISKEMYQYHLKVELNIKKQVGEFWDIIRENQRIGDWVKTLKFSFPNPKYTKLSTIDRSIIESEFFRAINTVSCAVGSTKGILELQSDSDDGLVIKKENDLANMAALCFRYGYELSVFFAKSGELKYGDEKRMTRELNIKAIHERIEEPENNDVIWPLESLIEWLNEVYNDSQYYNDAHTFTNTRKRRTKRLSH
jgi:hypothetical protein